MFSNVSIYMQNSIADHNISTWELHSDDGAGHFIVKLYNIWWFIYPVLPKPPSPREVS